MRTNNWLTNNARDRVHFNHLAVAIDYSPPFLRGSDDENQLPSFRYSRAHFLLAVSEPLLPARRFICDNHPASFSAGSLFCERRRGARKEPLSHSVPFCFSYVPYCAMRSDERRINDRRSFATAHVYVYVCVQECVRSLLSRNILLVRCLLVFSFLYVAKRIASGIARRSSSLAPEPPWQVYLWCAFICHWAICIEYYISE